MFQPVLRAYRKNSNYVEVLHVGLESGSVRWSLLRLGVPLRSGADSSPHSSSRYFRIEFLNKDDEKLVAGDTIPERYEAYVRFYREAVKQWAIYGIQYQLGSSAYTYKTYPHYFNLLELAPDPIIRLENACGHGPAQQCNPVHRYLLGAGSHR